MAVKFVLYRKSKIASDGYLDSKNQEEMVSLCQNNGGLLQSIPQTE